MSLTFTLLLFLYSNVSHAQKSPAKGWRVGLGITAINNPLYEGDNEYGLAIVPDLRLKYGRTFFMSVGEGLGLKLQPWSFLELGPIIRYKFPRNEGNEPNPFQVSGKTSDLKGLGDVDGAAEAGGFFILKPLPFLSARFEARQGSGGHKGLLTNARVSVGLKMGPVIQKFNYGIRHASKEFMNTYFGVTAEQSSRSGLAQYTAKSGVRSIGGSSVTIMPFAKIWSVIFIANYRELQKPIAQSSLVKTRGQPHQHFFGLSLSCEI